MFTYKFFLKPSSNAVQLRIVNNRKKTEFSLKVEATENELEDALSEFPKSKNAYLAQTLGAMKQAIREIQLDFLRDGRDVDLDVKEIKKIITCKIFSSENIRQVEEEMSQKLDESSLFGCFYEKRMNAKSNKGYKASIEYTYKKMQAFCADEKSEHGKPFDELTFDDISLKWLNAFDEWLVDQGSAQNSRNIHFKNIRTVMNRAIDEELTEKYPFRRFRIKPEATRKRSFTVENLRKLFDYPVEEYQKFYLDMFKLTFFLIGINTTDLYNLTSISDGRIEYRRAKTHRLYSIKVEPEAMEIIERWNGKKNLLCPADRWSVAKEFNKNFNIALKKIGEHKQIPGRGGKIEVTPLFPDISTYWARHTWATVARKIGVSVDDIALALGHADDRHETTFIYIDQEQVRDAVDKANRRVIDYVLYGKM